MKNSMCLVFLLVISLDAALPSLMEEYAELDYSPVDLSSEEMMARKFEEWAGTHGKVYSDNREKKIRLEIFKENLLFIHEQNQQNLTYKLGLNHFTDLRDDDVTGCFKMSAPEKPSDDYKYREGDYLKPRVDWRNGEKRAVTRVENQGGCGSCWAFSAVAAVEGLHAIITDKSIPLSTQELIDCDGANGGCAAGSPYLALKYIKNKGGIVSNKDYRYKAHNGTCNRTILEKAHKFKIDGYKFVPQDEMSLQKAVSHQPISVTIAIGEAFHLYKRGVFSGGCGQKMNHAVTIVGYGSQRDATGKKVKYWIVKNSYGKKWGRKGYIHMVRGKNICGITEYASYPIKKGQFA